MKLRTILFLITALLLVFLVARKLMKTDSNKANAPAAQGKGQPLMVSAYVVKPQSVSDKIIASGTVIANEMADVKNEIAGRVVRIYFKEGSRVSKGEMLVKIFDGDLQAQLKKLKSQQDLAEKNEARMQDLLKIQGVSQQEYDAVQNQVYAVKSDIDFITTQIEKTNIKAPFDGTIGLRTISEGAFIASNTRIATIQDIDPVKIDFTVPERYMNLIHTGDAITFTVAGLNEQFKGDVFAIEPSIDLSTRSLTIRALSPNKESKILPGAFARIEITLAEIKDAIMIPTQALIPQLKGQKVYIVRNGLAANREVETGLRNDSTIRITNGLQQGDTVLVTGLLALRPDQPVKVTSVR